MKCLWITRKYPRPTNSGELIYSDGLVRATAAAGVALTVIAHDNEEIPLGNAENEGVFIDPDGVEWRLGDASLGSRLRSLVTPYPADSWRLKEGGPEDLLKKALAEEAWDTVVIDHAALGWAWNTIKEQRKNGGIAGDPAVVYVSHNHEAKVRREVAKQSTGFFLKKWALRFDAEKYARQEEILCREVDLVTAITPAEVEAYRELFPQQRFLSLTPGYRGPFQPHRRITEGTPRRVVMSGSFEWIAKQINLERFLEQAAHRFAEAGVELRIVGKADEGFRQTMQARYPQIDFVGRVPEMGPYLIDARMGLIVEEFGGGFKLKTLEYIFHGLPLAGLVQAVEGLPLRSPNHLLLEPDTPALVDAVLDVIDDVTRLDTMRAEAYSLCVDAFHWEDRGRDLLSAIQSLRGGDDGVSSLAALEKKKMKTAKARG